ncbi:MAG: LysR substrate-binding domain-containing protein [Pseudomonadota bacterium]
MNIRDLQYFAAVADLQHFGHAAERCFVSQPTLSGQIKKLEAELDVTLFERNNRNVMLTETGEEVLRSAQRILREVDTIHDVAKSHRDPLSGKFRLGAFPTLAPYVLPQVVPKVRDSLPALRLILIEEKTAVLIDKLLSGEIDAALLALPLHESALNVHPLFEDEFLLAVSSDHELAEESEVSQSAISERQLLLLEEGHCLRDQALEVCNLNRIAEEQEFRATSLETLRQMVKAGTGITFMPRIAVRTDDAGIRYIPFSGQPPKRTIGLVWRKTTARKSLMDAFVELLSTLAVAD